MNQKSRIWSKIIDNIGLFVPGSTGLWMGFCLEYNIL